MLGRVLPGLRHIGVNPRNPLVDKDLIECPRRSSSAASARPRITSVHPWAVQFICVTRGVARPTTLAARRTYGRCFAKVRDLPRGDALLQYSMTTLAIAAGCGVVVRCIPKVGAGATPPRECPRPEEPPRYGAAGPMRRAYAPRNAQARPQFGVARPNSPEPNTHTVISRGHSGA